MSLRFQPLNPVPEETRRVVKSAFHKGHPYITFADEMGNFLDCWDFTEMYSTLGKSAIHPAKFALAMILQHAEGLSDNQVCERVSDSLLWKYFLRLPIDFTAWDSSDFSKFRDRLIESESQRLIFDKLLEAAREAKLLKHSKQRTDATHINSVAKHLSRIELLFDAVRNCLEELLDVEPLFLHRIKRPEWTERYFTLRAFNYKLPKGDKAREELANTIGNDGFYIIEKLSERKDLQGLESVYLLCRVLEEQFSNDDGPPRFLKTEELKPSGERIHSVHDPDATVGSKRGENWLGYRLHLSETIDDGAPHLITNVETTQAHINDSLVLRGIHKSLIARDLQVDEHWVDSGYANAAELCYASKEDGIDVITRLTNGHSWQSLNGTGFDISFFQVDWKKRIVTCPQGIKSQNWKQGKTNDEEINVSFPAADCQKCPVREQCTKASSRKLHLKPKPIYDYMAFYRRRQKTAEFIEKYKKRAGIEGTISQSVSRTGVRRSRFVGLVKTHADNLMAATALNMIRIGYWLMKLPLSATRQSRYEMAFAAGA